MNTKRIITITLVVAAPLFGSVGTAHSQIMLEKAVIAAGGNTATGANTRVTLTVGQPVVGLTASTQVKAQLGFWTAEKGTSGVASSPVAPDISITVWPNPASSLTKIDIALPMSSELDVRLFDINGREVKSLFTGSSLSANHSIMADFSTIPSGTYIIAASIPGELVQKRISIIR